MMPAPTLERIKHEDDSWEIRLRNPKDLKEVLGRDVLNAFCRCFVHADRLQSIVSCMYASHRQHGQDSVAYKRDVHTLLWFTIGTLHEFAKGIQQLQKALEKRRILDYESEPWCDLKKFEKRWNDNEFFRKMRNKVAFHVDKDVVNKGLNEMIEEPYVTLVQGQGPRGVDCCLPFGFLTVLNGLDMNIERYGELVDVVMNDHAVTVKAIQKVFILATQAAGILGPRSAAPELN